ncbi:MAG TPA: ABC transporter permease, partial [Vicinamibacterales bacterium]
MPDFHARIRAALSSAVDPDVVDELALHAESMFESLVGDGVSEVDALAQIDRLIDGWRRDPASLRRVIRRAAAVVPPQAAPTLTSGAWADAIYGWRVLRSRPGYAVITVLTIALGVGAVTTLFSVANGVLLRPLSWAKGDGLVRIIESRGGRQGRVPGTMLNGSYLAWAEEPQTIEGIGAFTEGALTLTGAGDAARVTVTNVSPSLFEVLRAKPLRGRMFLPVEGREGNWHFVILSEGIWEQRFGRREDIVGHTIVLDNAA